MTDRASKRPADMAEPDDELNLADLLTQIAARKWLVAGLAVFGALAGGIVGQLGPNEYRAEAVVQIEERSSGTPLPEELIGNLLSPGQGRRSSFDTEIHVIRSRLVLGPVVKRFHADTRAIPVRAPVIGDLLARRGLPGVNALLSDAYQRPGESLALDSLTVSDALLGTALTLRVTGPESFEVTGPRIARIEGRVGELVETATEARLQVADIRAPVGREYTLLKEPLRNSVARLRNNLEVSERQSSGVVDFSFTSEDPDFSVRVVNAVVDSYREQNLQRRSAEIDQSITFIENKLPDIHRDLEEATAALSAFREQQDNLELSLGTQELLDQLVQIQNRLEELEFQEQQLAQRLTPNHPDYQKLLAERARLESRLAQMRADLKDVPAAEQELARFQEPVVSARELERQLTARAEQLRVLKASTVGNIRVLEPAEVARLVGPDRIMPLLIGFALGLFGAIGLILFLNFLRRGIEDAREVEETGLAVLGSINKVPALAGLKPGRPEYALARSDPENIAIEALRGLRTGLRFTLAARNARTVMITSCAPSDGKSFVALNLAMVNAQLGTRVLLIDADMRRGKLGRNFGITRRDNGLAQVLVGECDIAAAVHHDTETGLDFLGTGGLPPNPAELLETSAFSDLLSVLSERYDLVIVDAPPVLAVSDAAIIGQKTDIVLMVIRHLVTARPELQSALKSLENVGITPAGAIINQYDMKKSRYGQHGYHYGAYSYKYKSGT